MAPDNAEHLDAAKELFAILVAIAMAFSFDKIVEAGLHAAGWWAFLIFMLNAIRFFQGNVLFMSFTYSESDKLGERLEKIINFYFTLAEAAVLCFIALFQNDLRSLLLALSILAALDVAWQLVAWVLPPRMLTRTSLSWIVLNGVTLALLAAVLLKDWGTNAALPWIAGFYVIATLIDYTVNANLYFGARKRP